MSKYKSNKPLFYMIHDHIIQYDWKYFYNSKNIKHKSNNVMIQNISAALDQKSNSDPAVNESRLFYIQILNEPVEDPAP